MLPLKAGGKVIEDKGKVRHVDGDFFLHEGVCDTARKVAFAGAYAAPEQAADIVGRISFPMLHIPAGKPGPAGSCRCRSQKSSPAWWGR